MSVRARDSAGNSRARRTPGSGGPRYIGAPATRRRGPAGLMLEKQEDAMAPHTRAARAATLAAIICVSIAGAGAQTVVKLPKNKYTPQQDAEIGREAAA